MWVLSGGNNSFSLLLSRKGGTSLGGGEPNPQTSFHKDLVFFSFLY